MCKEESRTCGYCGVDISHRPAKAKFCSDKCRTTLTNKTNARLKAEAKAAKPRLSQFCIMCNADLSHHPRKIKFCNHACSNAHVSWSKSEELKRTDPTAITCKECDFCTHSLVSHLKGAHSMTPAQYKNKHGEDSPIVSGKVSKVLSDASMGENNPGWKHGGKLSHFSKKFVKYSGLDEDAKEELIRDAYDNKTYTPENMPNRIEYYLSRGMSERQAKAALTKRQQTFTKEKCIEKYGEVDGLIRWQERQEKWMDSFYDKSEAEIEDINRRKQSGGSPMSKISMELFESLEIDGAEWGASRDGNSGERQVRLPNGRHAKLDFTLGDKVIEFFGDYWHSNPTKYAADYKFTQASTPCTASDIWAADEQRLVWLGELGYEVMVVWEDEFRRNPDAIIAKCLEFLNN